MSEEGVKCQKCGTMNPPNAKYCLNCGAKLGVVEAIKKIEINDLERAILRVILLSMTIILILDILLNRYVYTIAKIPLIGAPYAIAFILTVISLYIVTKKAIVSSLEALLLFATAVIGFVATIILYAISVSMGIETYSPIWIIYLLVLPTTWRIFKRK